MPKMNWKNDMTVYTHTRQFKGHPSRWTWVSRFLRWLPLSVCPSHHVSFSDKRRDGSEQRGVEGKYIPLVQSFGGRMPVLFANQC